MINTKRVVDLFKRLVSIDSPSFGERKMADYITNELKNMGIDVLEDNAGKVYGSDCGNLYAYIKGDIEGSPILLSSHLDTVEPSHNKKAVVNGDVITSDGTSVLGADDISGLCAIIEAIKSLKENNISHRDIEIVFTIAEEVYIKGSKVFDYSKLKAKSAYVLDLSGDIGTVAVKAPTLISFSVDVFGKSSHAGFNPDDGINSIEIVSNAVAKLKQGKIDDDTTFNIGVISGGTATNIVSEKCNIKGEIRSLEHNKALGVLENLKNVFETVCNEYKAKYNLDYTIDLVAYNTDTNSSTVKRLENVCNDLGIKTDYISTFGGSDNNSFALNGIEGVVLACSMHQSHTTEEYCKISELENVCKIVYNLLQSEV